MRELTEDERADLVVLYMQSRRRQLIAELRELERLLGVPEDKRALKPPRSR